MQILAELQGQGNLSVGGVYKGLIADFPAVSLDALDGMIEMLQMHNQFLDLSRG